MVTAAEHYDRLLAEHYTWMLGGDVRETARGQADLLRARGVVAQSAHETAIDLGCGSGAQTLALVELGFSPVIAVDSSARLLAELAETVGAATAVRTVHADLREALTGLVDAESAALVVCMGDTLPHLPGRNDVSALVNDAARLLRPGGHLVFTYRDLTPGILEENRFLLVRGTEHRVLTCALEECDPDTVMVHDLLHVRQPDGGWTLRTSSYPKLRLDPAWVAGQCRRAGLEVRHDGPGPRGMQLLHAVRPPSDVG